MNVFVIECMSACYCINYPIHNSSYFELLWIHTINISPLQMPYIKVLQEMIHPEREVKQMNKKKKTIRKTAHEENQNSPEINKNVKNKLKSKRCRENDSKRAKKKSIQKCMITFSSFFVHALVYV